MQMKHIQVMTLNQDEPMKSKSISFKNSLVASLPRMTDEELSDMKEIISFLSKVVRRREHERLIERMPEMRPIVEGAYQ